MPPYTVHFERLESLPVAVMRRDARQSDLPRVVPEICGLVWNALKAQQIRGGRHVAIYWDGTIRLEVGVELNKPFDERDGVVRSATPAGPVAWTTHLGPYGGLGAAHDAIRRWFKDNGRKAAGPSWEIYGHWQREWDTDPSRIRTDIYYLVSDETGS
jgi:effector-binding domain-containing protein